jgi:hypothetical protein
MTQDLANKLIAHYESVIQQVQQCDDNGYGIIRKNKVSCGICYASRELFNKDMYSDDWVHRMSAVQGNVNKWGKYPSDENTKEQNITALQLRVDILKTFKEN